MGMAYASAFFKSFERLELFIFDTNHQAARANFEKLGNVKAITNAGQGYTKYYMGDFMDYSNVLKFRKKLVANGLIDCFVVGEFKNNIITSKEARDLLGQ